MNTFDHITSIHRSLSGQITVEEQQKLDHWLEADPTHKVMAREVILIWKAARAYQQSQGIDTEGALARFKKARAAEAIPAITTTKVISLPARRTSYKKVIAAAAAVLIFGLFFFSPDLLQSKLGSIADISTASGQMEQTTLEDGTMVFVNEVSVFSFPMHFASEAREVQLKGEAFFKVAKDETRPFTIATDQLEVKVLGTSFNIYAYPDKSTEEVAVATGKVIVTIKSIQKEFTLEAGDHLLFDRGKQTVIVRNDPHQNAQAWRTGVLTFDSTPLAEVCQTLEKYFDISIHIKNETLGDCPVTVPAFNKPSAAVVLETLKTAFSMELEQKGANRFEFSGGACQ